MIARRLLCCFAGAIAFGTAPAISGDAIAQTTVPGPGSRVRVTAPDYDLRQATGRVLDLTADSITIDRDGWSPNVTLPVRNVSRLEVSIGKRPGLGFVKGAGAGFVLGTLAGLAFGALQYATCEEELCGLWFVVAVPTGAGAGLIIGGIVGIARPPDRWEEVSLAGQSGRASRIGLSISF
jgi:hypothetical protein